MDVMGSFMSEPMFLCGVRGAAGAASCSCSLPDELEHSGNSSSSVEASLRPGRVLLLVELAESQSEASVP